MKSDVNGCATVENGQEKSERFTAGGRTYYQYDYRTPAGELFSCVGRSLMDCRTKRNNWLANH